VLWRSGTHSSPQQTVLLKIFKDHHQSVISWQPHLPPFLERGSYHMSHQSRTQPSHRVPCQIGIASAQIRISGWQWQKRWVSEHHLSSVNDNWWQLPSLAL
jgi:hypothetical protein